MDHSNSKIVFDEKLNIEVLTLTGMIEVCRRIFMITMS